MKMAQRRRSPDEPVLNRVLARARELAEQVRTTAERVHQEAEEARRLTEIARRQAERGRELSEAGREEAREVVNSIKWGIDTTGNGKLRPSGKDETEGYPEGNSLVFAVQHRRRPRRETRTHPVPCHDKSMVV
jgi:hypothetical protein